MTELMLEEMVTHLVEPKSCRTAELRHSHTVRTQRTTKRRRRATTSTYQGGISRRRNKRWSW